MLTATKTSFWRGRYDISVDGRPVTVWDGRMWKSGGDFDLDGQRYEVRANFIGSTYTMVDAAGATLASARRVGRKHWTVETARGTLTFRRKSMWSSEQQLLVDDHPIGSIRRTSAWRNDAAADLPGLPLPVQVFVIGVVLSMWESQQAAAAAAST